MNDIDRKAQETLEHNIALKASTAAHNLRTALADSQHRERCYRASAIVFGVAFVVQVAVNIWKWL